MNVLPPPGVARTLCVQSLVWAVGNGVFTTGSAVFFLHVAALTPVQVGIGFSAAGALSLLLSVPLGTLADRFGGRRIWLTGVLAEAAVLLCYPWLHGFSPFLVLLPLAGLAETLAGNGRSVYQAEVLQGTDRVRSLAFVRSAMNIGFFTGGTLAAIPLAVGTEWSYRAMVLGNILGLLVNAVMVSRMPSPSSTRPPTSPSRSHPAPAVSAAPTPPATDSPWATSSSQTVTDSPPPPATPTPSRTVTDSPAPTVGFPAPGAGSPAPVTALPAPGVGSPGSATGSLGPAVDSPRPATSSLEPAVDSPRPATSSLGPGVDWRGPVTSSPGPGVDPAGPGVDPPGPDIGSLGPGVGSRSTTTPSPIAKRPSVWRDRPFLVLVTLCAVLAGHASLTTEVIPLWLTARTDAPRVMLAVLFGCNTVMCVALQVPASRGVDSPTGIARALRRGGVAVAAACAALALSGTTSGWPTIALLLTGSALVTLGELWQSAGYWGVTTELPPPSMRGAYVGAARMSYGIQSMLGPASLTFLAIHGGDYGWLAIAAIFVLGAALVRPTMTWVTNTPRAGAATASGNLATPIVLANAVPGTAAATAAARDTAAATAAARDTAATTAAAQDTGIVMVVAQDTAAATAAAQDTGIVTAVAQDTAAAAAAARDTAAASAPTVGAVTARRATPSATTTVDSR